MSSFEWMELQTLTSDIDTARTRLQEARKRRDAGRIRALEDEITQAEKRRLQLVAHISTSIATAPEPPDTPKAAADPAPAEAAADADASPEAAAVADPVEAADGGADAPADAAVAEAPPVEESEAEPSPQPVAEAEAEAEPEPEPEPEPAPSRRARGSAAADVAATETAASDPPEAEQPASEPQTEIAAAAASPDPDKTPFGFEGGKNVWDQLTPTDIDRAKRELGVRRAEILARHVEELKALEVEQGQIDVLEQAIASFLQKFNAPGGEAAVVKLDQERELRQQGNN